MAQTIEDKIRVLEDIEAIKKLKASYCSFVDDGIAGDDKKMDAFLDLFTEDIIGDLGIFGSYKGKEALTKFFKEAVAGPNGFLVYSAHETHNPNIEVEGEKAHGSWYFDCPCTVRRSDKSLTAAWMHGRYEEDYVKLGGKWKFKTWKVIFEFFSPLDEGWVKNKIMTV